MHAAPLLDSLQEGYGNEDDDEAESEDNIDGSDLSPSQIHQVGINHHLLVTA